MSDGFSGPKRRAAMFAAWDAELPGDAERGRLASALLANLWRDRSELEALLAAVSGESSYEEAVYRYYHGSAKVFWAQEMTVAIRQRLEGLRPRELTAQLNPEFARIVEWGTGREFSMETSNARWEEEAGPILAAFFHARFFLEMAVRYSSMPEPPTVLPSGWAALLTLYGLR